MSGDGRRELVTSALWKRVSDVGEKAGECEDLDMGVCKVQR